MHAQQCRYRMNGIRIWMGPSSNGFDVPIELWPAGMLVLVPNVMKCILQCECIATHQHHNKSLGASTSHLCLWNVFDKMMHAHFPAGNLFIWWFFCGEFGSEWRIASPILGGMHSFVETFEPITAKIPFRNEKMHLWNPHLHHFLSTFRAFQCIPRHTAWDDYYKYCKFISENKQCRTVRGECNAFEQFANCMKIHLRSVYRTPILES